VQVGFTEGIVPGGSYTVAPELYTELKRTYCDPAYSFVLRGAGTFDNVFSYYSGSYRACPAIPRRRCSTANPVLDFGYHKDPYGRFDGTTEVGNFTHIEPIGTYRETVPRHDIRVFCEHHIRPSLSGGIVEALDCEAVLSH
jgi:hypothetical protein